MKSFNTILILLLALTNIKSQNYKVEAEQLIQTAVNKGQMVGLSAGFAKGGQILWESAAGFSDQKNKIPFEIGTLTRIASVTKPMTAIAVMQLVEQGKVSLDDSFHKHFPDYPKDDKGTFTIRQLLQHSAGLGAYTNNKERENKINYESLADATIIFKDRPLLFKPGSDFAYTSYGYTLLGMIIEKASGMSLEAYMKKYIWSVAGMDQTLMFDKSLSSGTSVYHKNHKGKIKAAQETNLSDRLPAGGVYSAITDMLKFGNAVLDGSLIRKESLAALFEDSGLKKTGNPYGMGWHFYGNNPELGPIYGHTGAQTGSSAFLMILPETEVVSMVMSNTSGALQEVSNLTVKLFQLAGKAD